MHYYIDGYNLMFRLLRSRGDLQSQRDHVIRDLNDKISAAGMDASLVFDATFTQDNRTRSHFGNLEILFTDEGETADEYIIDELRHSPTPRRETVVTSDKALARHARDLSAKTESVEDFMCRLNRTHTGKQKKIVSLPKKTTPNSTSPPRQPSPATQASPIKTIRLTKVGDSSQATLDYYREIFEAGYRELQVSEETRSKKKSPEQAPRNRKKEKSLKKTFNDVEVSDPMERWLKIFSETVEEKKTDFK
jgi:predicted RNA-binding protein with PIN domain